MAPIDAVSDSKSEAEGKEVTAAVGQQEESKSPAAPQKTVPPVSGEEGTPVEEKVQRGLREKTESVRHETEETKSKDILSAEIRDKLDGLRAYLVSATTGTLSMLREEHSVDSDDERMEEARNSILWFVHGVYEHFPEDQILPAFKHLGVLEPSMPEDQWLPIASKFLTVRHPPIGYDFFIYCLLINFCTHAFSSTLLPFLLL